MKKFLTFIIIGFCLTNVAWANIGGACGTYSFTFNGLTYSTISAEDDRCWLDRNLGATEVATSSTDYLAYGWLYQWGRPTDGHQIINPLSNSTTTKYSTVTPYASNYVIGVANPIWGPVDNTLWQGVNGTNNPCPQGWRLPTATSTDPIGEWDTFSAAVGLDTCTSHCSANVFNTSLKLPSVGYRLYTNGARVEVASTTRMFSSSFNGSNAAYGQGFTDSSEGIGSYAKGFGLSVRCIKDQSNLYNSTGSNIMMSF